MKKLSAIIVILLLIVFTFFPKHSKQADIEKGISIDIARTHYTKESIKKIIGELSRVNGRYLQLHLADNDNYSIYSNVLDQTSTHSNHYYLTKAELRELVQYANKHHVQLIPELDFPAHSKAMLTLLHKHHPSQYRQVVSSYDNTMLDFQQNQTALDVSRQLINEVADIFYQTPYKDNLKMVIGGDEVPGGGAQQRDFVSYMNQLADTVQAKHYTPKMWNDSLTHEGLKNLNHSIIIMYWHQPSKQSPSPTDFFTNHFMVENFNRSVYYVFPRAQQSTHSLVKQKADIADTRLTDFNTANMRKDPHFNSYINGEYLTFWGEFASDLKQTNLIEYVYKFIRIYFNS